MKHFRRLGWGLLWACSLVILGVGALWLFSKLGPIFAAGTLFVALAYIMGYAFEQDQLEP